MDTQAPPSQPDSTDTQEGEPRQFKRRHPLTAVLIRRIAAGIGSLLVISVLIFAGTQVLPGDVAQAILGRNATPAALQEIRQKLELDKPAYVRYLDWLKGLLHGDLGNSATGLETGVTTIGGGPQSIPVWSLIRVRVLNSLILAFATLLLLIPLGVALGVLAALKSGGALDRSLSTSSVALIAIPEFVTASFLILVFSTRLGLLPPVSLLPVGETALSRPSVLVLPIVTLLLASLAQLMRMVRAGMLDVLREPYVELARLSGISEWRVVFQYALRNALAPTVQVIALTAQWLIGGIIVTEAVFNYPGVGQALVQAVTIRDVPTIQSVSILIATVYITLNIVADLAVLYLVPKLRTSGRESS